MIFDTHAHYDDKEFLEDCSEVLASLPQNGIGNVVNVCASIRSLHRVIPMTERQPYIWGAAGVHPDYAEEITEDILGQIFEGMGLKLMETIFRLWPDKAEYLSSDGRFFLDRLLGTDLFRTGKMDADTLIAHFAPEVRSFEEKSRQYRLYE